MKRTLVFLLAALAAVVIIAGLVHVLLIATHLSQPADTTVQGLTSRRLWATISGLLALISVVIGGLALARSTNPFGSLGVIVALAAGGVAVINGALVLAVASGGPGSGNGVVGGAGALVLGVVGIIMGGLALNRSHRRRPVGNVPIK